MKIRIELEKSKDNWITFDENFAIVPRIGDIVEFNLVDDGTLYLITGGVSAVLLYPSKGIELEDEEREFVDAVVSFRTEDWTCVMLRKSSSKEDTGKLLLKDR